MVVPRMATSIPHASLLAGHCGTNVLWAALYPNSPLGRFALPKTVENITLDDVKSYFWSTYVKDGAVMMFCGDVTVEQGQALARTLRKAIPERSSNG